MPLITHAFDELLTCVARALQGSDVPVVLVGGCASALYRFSSESAKVIPRPLLTKDADLAMPNTITQQQSSLHDMLSRVGLQPVPDDRPVNQYRMSADANESIEIICPVTGLSAKQKQSQPVLVKVQPNTTAEALDYVDVLLTHPWQIDLADVSQLKVEDSLPVKVPNPVAYGLQKILIRSKRKKKADRQKDAYYIYETALIFREARGALRREAETVRKSIHPKWWHDGVRNLDVLFSTDNSEGTLDAFAVAQANGINVTPKMIARTIQPLLHLLKET